MKSPSLNTFLEKKLKEFDKHFPSSYNEYGRWKSIPMWDVLDVKSFISASISEAWEIKSLKEE